MKKPWVIGLISIVPGMGFIVLGKILQGFVIFFVVALLACLGMFTSAENASRIFFTMSFAAWLSQLYYSIHLAQHLSRLAAGLVPQRKPVDLAPLPAGASSKEKALHKARLAMMELLPPGKYVRIALEGQTSSISPSSLLVEGSMDIRVVYFGVAGQDLVIIKTDKLSNPQELIQVPFEKIRSFKSAESLLYDIVDFDLGESKPLRIQVARRFRPEKQQLLAILSGQNAPGEAADDRSQPLSAPTSPFVSGQAKDLAQNIHKQGQKKASPLLRYAGISGIFFSIGYALGFAVLGTWAQVSEVISTDVNLITHLICFGPAMILTAFIIAALVIMIQSRFNLPSPTAQRINLIVSVIIGFIAYIPAQFLLLMGVAF
jgi:hypothetical protein